jgi:3-deoxy-D-manno-octulosonic acid kinase
MQANSIERTGVPPMNELVRGPYLIGGREYLSDEVATRIVQLMRSVPDDAPRGVLAGRGYTGIQNVEGLGRVFVKQYAHGGLLRHVTGGSFLCVGPSRSLQEFLMLERVREIGINAPKPMLFVNKGSFLYRTWLFMEEIAGSRNLAEVSRSGKVEDADVLHEAMTKLGEQVLSLINHKIFHVDLHPGNVLVQEGGRVSIVDFDKAHEFKGGAERLRELYLRRWRRAVIKHKLSPVLTEVMSLTLRSYHE